MANPIDDENPSVSPRDRIPVGTPVPDGTAVLVIRAWREGAAAQGLRARITSTLDTGSAEEVVSTAADVEEICASVRAWLDAFLVS